MTFDFYKRMINFSRNTSERKLGGKRRKLEVQNRETSKKD
jgi:hypothetical protein